MLTLRSLRLVGVPRCAARTVEREEGSALLMLEKHVLMFDGILVTHYSGLDSMDSDTCFLHSVIVGWSLSPDDLCVLSTSYGPRIPDNARAK